MGTELFDAVRDACVRFENRGYDTDRAFLFVHPKTIPKTNDTYLRYDSSSPPSISGLSVEETAALPENVILLVHSQAARYGPDSLVFETVEKA